ncbi:MAG: hypothetical protein JXN60_00360 [Lentisphaerae bacterium]|nr:hypothetical protein [Lentisphaerota bacterium]
MKRFAFCISLVVLMMCLAGISASAAGFDPLFRILQIEGICTVQKPGETQEVNALEDYAYPYGTRVKTGRNSSAVIRLSQGNDCRILAKADLAITEDVKNPKIKVIKLDAGKVDITLDEEFDKSGDGLNVETASAICGAIGCKFSVDARMVQDLQVVVILCIKGKISIFGPHFKVPFITTDQGITVSSPRDRSFTRVKNVKGSYSIDVIGSDGEPKTIDIKMGSVIKIWRRKSEDGKLVIISTLVADETGALVEIITATERLSDEFAYLGEKSRKDTEKTRKDDVDDDGFPIISTTTTTTSTTTTTTIPPSDLALESMATTTTTTTSTTTTTTLPSPTPVGKR